jgi:transposase
MASGVKYPDEVRERAVRLVVEALAAEPGVSQSVIHKRIGERLGVNPATLRGWMRKSQESEDSISSVTKAEAKEIRELKAEIRELKRANEILKAASSFFARELDPKLPF